MAKLFIAGEQRDASDGGTTEIRNPASGELVDRVAAATPGDVDRAIDAADAAFKKWSAVPPPQRAEVLYKAAHLLKEREKDLARLLTEEQGKPPGVVNIVPGPARIVGETLLKDPRVRKIGFTGATSTGKHIMEVAAQNVKRVTLELGGSDPMIVCDDADIDEAVSAASVGRFFNCGQACLAIKRLYLFDKIYDQFVAKLVAKMDRLRVGNGIEQGVIVGPLHTAAQRDEVEEQVKDAVKRGAKVLAGGSRPVGEAFAKGNFYLPTVLVDVDEQSKIVQEEVFGPALPIMRVKDLDE